MCVYCWVFICFSENVYVHYDVDERTDVAGREHVRLPDKQPSHSVYAWAAGRRAAKSARSVFDFVYHTHAFERHRNIHTRQTVPGAIAM